MKALLVVDKPKGITSHQAVAKARQATGIRKIGHAGTLDPMATGVLVLALGQATRLIRYLQDQEKEYVARVRFGIATDSLDADGTETERVAARFSEPELVGALDRFRGEILQTPPMVSAVKVDGTRLYDLARAGKEVDRAARPVTIHELRLLNFTSGEFPVAELMVVCSKGTYIRVLADDLARSLSTRAHLIELCRTRVGPLGLSVALSLDHLWTWGEHLIDPRAAVAQLATWPATPEEEASVRAGRRLPAPGGHGPWAILDQNQELLAVYRPDGGEAVAEVVLV